MGGRVQDVERAGVLVVRDDQLALIERVNQGRRYWVIPGGGIEPGESIEEAARREAHEELGVAVALGRLRVRIDHLESDGTIQRQWYFDAEVEREDIRVIGPERQDGHGTYRAVWIPLDSIDLASVLPSSVVGWVQSHHGNWPTGLLEIDES